jgi:NTP pyrophosphatase (non-canonical NTP hydrolase)
MNERTIELLDILQEECAEVVQAISKLRRFGDMDGVHTEIGDVMGVIKELVGEGFIDEETMISGAERKIVKLEKYMKNKKGPLGTSEMTE